MGTNLPTRQYQVAIWDFDGTLANSLPLGVSLFNSLADRYGFLPVTDTERVRKLPRRVFLAEHRVPWYRIAGLVRQLRAAQKDRVREVPVCEGVAAVVKELSARGITQGVLSSNTGENISRFLEQHELASHFSFITGGIRLSGKKRPLQRLVRKWADDPAACLAIGDEQRDVVAARAAGVDSAAVTWGFQHRERLATENPAFIVEHPTDLLSLFPTADRPRSSAVLP